MSTDAPPRVAAAEVARAGWDRRAALVGGLAVAAGVVVAALVKARCGLPPDVADAYTQLCYSDVPPLWFFERLSEGAAPYLEHPVEYPVLTGLWMWLAAWPADGPASFYWWTVVLLVGAGAVTGAALGGGVGRRAALVVALAPTLWISAALNWDLPAVALATIALVAHRRGADGLAGVAIGLGTAAKLWPVLLLPGVVLGAAAVRGTRAGRTTVVAALVSWVVVNVPVALAAPDGWLRFYELSRERGADWDSLWRVVGGALGEIPTGGTLNLVVAVTTAAGIVGVVIITLRRHAPERWHLIALPVVTWFLLAGKVWSPQFTLWLLPLLALTHPPVRALVAVGVADVAVSVTRFPYIGGAAGLEDPWPAWPFEVAVLVRAAVVAVVVLVVWIRAAEDPRDSGTDGTGGGGGTGGTAGAAAATPDVVSAGDGA